MKSSNSSRFSTYLMRGVLFLLPVIVTVLIASFVYHQGESWLGEATAYFVRLLIPVSWLGPFKDGHIPGLSLLMLLSVIMGLGWMASMKVGRRGLRLIDLVFLSIPFIRAIYSATRKVVDAIGDPKQSKFQRVVFINWPSPTTRVIGFVSAEVINSGNGEKYLAVYVPHVPNPTSGFVMWVPEKDTTDAGMTPQEGFSLYLSLGVLAPPTLPVTKSTTPGA
jgi:uncharacterized membrane protein